MESLTSYVQEMTEGRIDFAGQALVELISRFVLIGGAIIAFFVGFAMQSLFLTLAIYGLVVVVLALIVLPAWPMYNAHPVVWLPTIETKKKETSRT